MLKWDLNYLDSVQTQPNHRTTDPKIMGEKSEGGFLPPPSQRLQHQHSLCDH